MTSMPPAITRSMSPERTACAAKCTACCDEPHCRSTVVPGTDSGSPAESAAVRAILNACGPTWLTHPRMTSSTRAGSIPVRSTRARSAWAARSAAWTPDRPPPRRPTGVRTAPTMNASVTGTASLPPPVGRAFLEESRRSLAQVSPEEERQVQELGRVEGLFRGHVRQQPEGLPPEPDRLRADPVKRPAVLLDRGQHGVAVGIDVADERDPVRLGGVDRGAREHHFQQYLAGQRAGQVGDDDHREEPDARLGHREG